MESYKEMAGKVIAVTPEMARVWLETRRGNRKVRGSKVIKYAAAMSAGHWTVTHQGIAFSSGILIDGQHRLLAVSRSGETVLMFVVTGCPSEGMMDIDRGFGRTIANSLQIVGENVIHGAVPMLNAMWNHYAWCELGAPMWNGVGNWMPEEHVFVEFAKYHRYTVKVVMEHLPGASHHACIRAAFGTAVWTEPEDRLIAAMDQFHKGGSGLAGDLAISVHRSWVDRTREKKHQKKPSRYETFFRTMYAIRMFTGREDPPVNAHMIKFREKAIYKLPASDEFHCPNSLRQRDNE